MLLQDYVAALQAEIADLHSRLGRGGAHTFDEYKGLVGQITGLTRALNVLQELYQSTPKEER